MSNERRSVTLGRLPLADVSRARSRSTAPTIRRVQRRTVTILVSTITAIGVLAGCDTGDGKQLQPYDPGDYPTQTVASTVEDSFGTAATFDVDSGAGASSASPAAIVEPFSVVAPWQDGGEIDPRFTCDGLDVAPAISWGSVPAGTVEVAIAFVDDSAVSDGQPFVHWVMGGLDPAEIALTEGDAPPGALQALNFFGDVDYGGPCPPPGEEPHLYRLTAYALNQQLELADGDTAVEFLDTIAKLTIASSDVTGFYQR